MTSNTLVHRFWSHVNGFPLAPAMSIMKTTKDDGDKTAKFNWHQSGVAVAAIMSALRKRGIKKGDRVAVIGWNRPEWVWADMAIASLGGVTVAIYPNDSAKQVNYILGNSGAKLTISTDKEQLAKVEGGETLQLDLIGYDVDFRVGQTFFDKYGRVTLTDEFAGVDEELDWVAAQMGADGQFKGIEPSDLATLIYTSGSSGTPKGCKITHDNIVAAVTSLIAFGVTQDPDKDRTVSYLPLAHVLERVDGMGLCIWNRTPVAFSTIDEMAKNVRAFKPTMLCGVPAVWQKIADSIYNPKAGIGKILNKIWLWKPLLKIAIASERGSTMGNLFDKIIFNKVIEAMGGQLHMLVSGGAPISVELLTLYHRLGLELLEGYGATETTGGITTNLPSWVKMTGPKNKAGSVGRAVPGVEVKIVPMDGEDPNVGEIWLRGRQIISGYWELPEATSNSFTADGWYKTSDLGRKDDDGFIYILGRIDGMYKTLGGKFVSREKVEKAFQTLPLVQYTVPVAHARKFCSALIFINVAIAKTLVTRAVPAGVDAAAFYAEQDEVKKAVAEAVNEANSKLQHWEQVKKWTIMPIEATIENGIITATLKIRSKELIKRFADVIDGMYNSPK